jgi:hypothetical protein
MNSSPDLYSRLKEILNEPIDASPDLPESVSVLFQDDWVRILVVRSVEAPDLVTLEIESSLPLHTRNSHSRSEENSKARELLRGTIRTLEYFLRLQESGFQLDIIGQDCMWTAHMDFSECPDESMLANLLPS